MVKSDFSDSVERFASTCVEHYVHLRQQRVDLANRETEKGNEIVTMWTNAGVVVSRLQSLLTDGRLEVEFAAAAHLLKLGETDLALPVLERIKMRGVGFIAITARAMLSKHALFSKRAAPTSENKLP